MIIGRRLLPSAAAFMDTVNKGKVYHHPVKWTQVFLVLIYLA
jgi:hypothetical protein